MTDEHVDDDRQWWPEFMADEVMPPGRASPADWIDAEPKLDGDGSLVIGGENYNRSFGPGDVINFIWSEPRGMVEVTFKSDGSYLVVGGEPADYTNCWIPCDTDTVSGDLEELAKTMQEYLVGEAAEGTEVVGFAKWSLDGEAWHLDRVGDKWHLTPLQTSTTVQ